MMLERLSNSEPVRVGVIGAGMFGTQLVSQLQHALGMKPCIVADKVLERAYKAYELAGVSRSRIKYVKTAEEADRAIGEGVPAVTDDSGVLIDSCIDTVVEATGDTLVGAFHAYRAILAKKNIVMVNVETDALLGPLLKRMADSSGVVYSLAYGDQPAIIVEHYEWARTLGLEVVAAGRGAAYTPERRRKTPDDIMREPGWFSEYSRRFREAFGTELNPVMYNSFMDGTKPAVECAAVSNSTGLVPDVDGMHFASADLLEIPDVLSLREFGGVLENEHVVETVSSIYPDGRRAANDITFGTFVVFRAPNDYLKECMRHYNVILGKKSGNAILYRYVHMVGIEVPYTIAKIALYREPTGAPIGHYSDVACAAKRKLEKGTVIDACGGGYTIYGYLVKATTMKRRNLLPLGLAKGAKLKRDVSADELITFEDVELPTSLAYELWKTQDTIIPHNTKLSP